MDDSGFSHYFWVDTHMFLILGGGKTHQNYRGNTFSYFMGPEPFHVEDDLFAGKNIDSSSPLEAGFHYENERLERQHHPN